MENIIIFLNAFWNNGKGTTGGDQMLKEIFSRIRQNFDEVYCYTSNDGMNFLNEKIMQVQYKNNWQLLTSKSVLISYIARTIFALKCLSQKNIQIIYSGSDFFPDVISAFLYKLLYPKTKWVQSIFHIYPNWQTRPGNKIRNLVGEYLQEFSFLLIKRADIIININNEVKRELISKGFTETKILINTPGIDVNYLTNIQCDDTTPKYQAVYLGRLNPSKGIFDLVKIWQLVVNEIPSARLAIIGNGDENINSQLLKLITKANLTRNINLLGYLERDEAFRIIKNSDVFVFPSHEEGFAIAIAEAIACETPVIAWDLSVYNEIFENHIIKIKKTDIPVFAKSVAEIILNPNIYADRITNAKKFIKKYNLEKVAKRHLEILTKK